MLKRLINKVGFLIGITIGIAFVDASILYIEKQNCEDIWYSNVCLNGEDVEKITGLKREFKK